MVPVVTLVARLVAFAAVVLIVAAPAAGARPRYVYYDIAFVTITGGKGTVTSIPRGIHCPSACRVRFPRGTHVELSASPEQGWRSTGFSSTWCGEQQATCGFDLVSPHDCAGGACPLGAFGVRVGFVRDKTEGGASP
jgi:hypothetical protein